VRHNRGDTAGVVPAQVVCKRNGLKRVDILNPVHAARGTSPGAAGGTLLALKHLLLELREQAEQRAVLAGETGFER
jgi:hypothetical protein